VAWVELVTDDSRSEMAGFNRTILTRRLPAHPSGCFPGQDGIPQIRQRSDAKNEVIPIDEEFHELWGAGGTSLIPLRDSLPAWQVFLLARPSL